MSHKLRASDKAPQFTTTDVLGKQVDLHSYAKKHVLLCFLRYSGCPFCNLTIHRLAMEASLLAKNNCEIIAFIQSSKENIIKNIHERHALKPEFPIIADPDRKYYNLYGVGTSVKAAVKSIRKIPYWVHAVTRLGFKQTEVDGDIFMVPAFFLIDPGQQYIVRAEYGSSFYDHDTFTDIYESLIFGT